MKRFFILLVSALTLALTSCSGTRNPDANVLNLYIWTYYIPDSVIEKFEDEFGVSVNIDNYSTNEEMFNKLIAGGGKGYDIVLPSNDYASVMIRLNMLQEIDQSKFTNRQYINPAIIDKIDYDPEMKYAVPYYYGAAGVCVNKKKVPEGSYERTWNIFADPRFAGHATMMDDYREVFGDALAYLGYSVNTTDEKALDEAAKLVNEKWKPNLVQFDAEAFGKSFASGDFWLCQGYAEIVYTEVPEEKWDETIDFFIPESGGPAYLDSFMILKDAPHAAIANEFINFIHRPEIYAECMDAYNFTCYINTAAPEYMTTVPMYPASAMDTCELKNDIGEDLDKFFDRWEEVRFY